MSLQGEVFLAFAQYDPFSAEFWKNLPAIMSAAKDNPLGLIAGVVCVLSVVALALAWNESGRIKLIFFGALLASVVGILSVGNAQLGKKPATEGGMTISGKVMNRRTGGPIVRAKVSLATQGVPATASTNSDGFWVVDNFRVPPGTHVKIYVDAEGFQSYEGDVAADAAGQPPPILLDPLAPPPPPTPGLTISGTVFAAKDHSAVEGAEVTLESGGSPPQEETANTTSNGSFRVVNSHLKPDAGLKITVRAKGYRTVTRNLSRSSAKQRIEIQLERDPSN